VVNRSHDGRSMKILTIIDEYTRECLAIIVERRLIQKMYFPSYLIYL
jgi:hypothetical protein